jgi:hypothetical protein
MMPITAGIGCWRNTTLILPVKRSMARLIGDPYSITGASGFDYGTKQISRSDLLDGF